MPSTAVPRARAHVPLAALIVLFFLSGASALTYQVLWMRLLALVFGVTVHAASTATDAMALKILDRRCCISHPWRLRSATCRHLSGRSAPPNRVELGK